MFMLTVVGVGLIKISTIFVMTLPTVVIPVITTKNVRYGCSRHHSFTVDSFEQLLATPTDSSTR